ncbi:hypothetical protein GCM10009799_45250 [Nocardiopsis rhodophaea]|uniref:Uncharacterized protein n=1 Tax=Nocardiopsis rhodophaea TaxID=280238 RepID=A0ABN2TKK3_9ACTN
MFGDSGVVVTVDLTETGVLPGQIGADNGGDVGVDRDGEPGRPEQWQRVVVEGLPYLSGSFETYRTNQS